MATDTTYLRSSDPQTWFATIWDALDIYRETNNVSDAAWDDICTAMAWIEEEFDVASSHCNLCNEPYDPNAHWNKRKDCTPLCESCWEDYINQPRLDAEEVRKEQRSETR